MSAKVTAVCAAGVVITAVAGCGDEGTSGGGDGADPGLSLVTGVYPLEWLAAQVGGDRVEVRNLTEPGVDPHSLELSPREIGRVSEAEVAFYITGLQPAIDDAVAQEGAENALDVAGLVDLLPAGGEDDYGHDHGEEDPHMWLDPSRMSEAADGLAEHLAEVDPEHADEYRANAEASIEELTEIDGEYAATLEDCESRDIVANHAAFGYLAEDYDLNQISVSGIDPESEPSPARMAEVADLVEEHDITTVFTETLAPPETAETIAEETGAKTAVLDPLEGITEESPGDDYPSVMRANLDELGSALRCS
ncbi:metal ABC transporter substrate-binding protein [Allosalinactinospora lopnorensis]|uniref:metal ABC transporter substrate-binding protein n=1 Tax=Allosalinactinospora lopnorensis TaxID=1352348 RepID=UPI000A644A58|nr:metal ABC transporter substrate-binding protein [Allosalinactinospora lopnorensis]